MGMVCGKGAAIETRRIARIEFSQLIMLDHRGQPYESPHYRYEPFGRLKPLGLTRPNYLALHRALTPAGWRKHKKRRLWWCGIYSLPAALSFAWMSSALAGPKTAAPLAVGVWFVLFTVTLVVSLFWRGVPPVDQAVFRREMLRLKHCPSCCYDLSFARLDEQRRRLCPECDHAWWLPSDGWPAQAAAVDHTTSPPQTTTSTGLPPNS